VATLADATSLMPIRRAELAANLTAMGVPSLSTETFKALNAKVLTIPTDGTGEAESGDLDDPAVVYRKTRPDDWLKMPEVSENEIYLLFHLFAPTENLIAFTVTCTGSYLVEYGTVVNGSFVVSGSESVASGLSYEGTFGYGDWGDETSNAARQVMLKITGADILTFTQSLHSERNYAVYMSWNIVEFKGNLPSCTSCAVGSQTAASALQLLQYFSLEGTNNISNATNMFANCIGLLAITALYTSKVTNATGLFRVCTKLMALLDTFDFSNVTNASYMFYNTSSIQRIPSSWDFSSVTNISSMFYYCYSLIAAVLPITNITVASTPFTNCQSLKNILFTGSRTTFPAALTLQYSSLSSEAAVDFFNSLPTITTSRAITLTNTPAALTLTAEQRAVAEAKNWTITI